MGLCLLHCGAAGAFASDRVGSDAFSLAEGANGGDASAPLAAMICCYQASPSAIIRSMAPRAQSWYACIRSTIVCVLHMRSTASDAEESGVATLEPGYSKTPACWSRSSPGFPKSGGHFHETGRKFGSRQKARQSGPFFVSSSFRVLIDGGFGYLG